MRCVFSSIAWKLEHAAATASTLQALKADGIEASPGLFDRPLSELTLSQIAAVRHFWESHDLPVCAMQALLYGRPDLRLFGSDAERKKLDSYLRLVFCVAGELGAVPLVFGSPKNRTRGNFDFKTAFDVAVDFFLKLAPAAAAEGCTLCIEPNAVGYDCDFITTYREAAELVKAVDQPGFGLQLDAGVMRMNNENASIVEEIYMEVGLLPTHVHISAPYLEPVDMQVPFYAELAAVLYRCKYSGCLSVEMKSPAGGLKDISHAFSSVVDCFGDIE